MRKLLSLSGLVLGAAFIVAGLASSGAPTASAAARCDVDAVGARASAFDVSGDTATVKFKVTGAEGCKVELSVNSFYAPTLEGQPYSKQILFQRVTKTFTKGTYSMSAKLPTKGSAAKGCFYQVDLTYGTHNITPVLGYGHGKIDCSVTPPPTPQIKVCDLVTKQIVMVKAGYDKTRYTTDLTKCTVTPPVVPPTTPPTTPPVVTPPTPETPAELPHTGPMQVVAQMIGAGSLVASAGYYIQSRRHGN